MKIMSFNVLCGGPDEENRYWTQRKEMVLDVIKKYHPDSFGLQEAHHRWMNYLCKNLPEYDYVGVGRDNGKRMGEFSPVFYLKEKYEVVDSGNFWLSETPEKPGKGWDAACVRICSYAVLKDKKTGKKYVHYNTHLDHKGQVAMREGAKLIAERCIKYPDMPAFITGDFNVTPDSEAYKTVITSGYSDSRHIAEKSDNTHTFHYFDKLDEGELRRDIIDYIFAKNIKKCKTFKVITDKYNGEFPSDHYPVIAEFEI